MKVSMTDKNTGKEQTLTATHIYLYDYNQNLIGYSKILKGSRLIMNNKIKEEVLETLSKSKKELTELELKKSVPNVSRRLLRELLRDGKITKHIEYLHNSMKTETKMKIDNIEIILGDSFGKKPSKSITEKIKGTKVYKYNLVKESK